MNDCGFEIRPSLFDRLLIGLEDLVGVEIGVYRAQHARAMLKDLDIKKLYLIDPYIIYPGYSGLGVRNWQTLAGVQIHAQETLRRLGYSNRIKWLIMTSNDAVDKVKEKLDFVYIDGNHDYQYVMDDLTNWTPKVKKGGLMAGHDYSRSKKGVIEAVNEYCSKHKIKFEVQGEEWYYQK